VSNTKDPAVKKWLQTGQEHRPEPIVPRRRSDRTSTLAWTSGSGSASLPRC